MDEFPHLYAAEQDGLPCVSYAQHTLEKLSIIRYYLDGFNTACRRTRRYGGWTFVDSFAGPGVVHVDGSGRYFEGSALIGLRSGASVVHAVDTDSKNIAALVKRADAHGLAESLVVQVGDANVRVPELARRIPPRTPLFVLHDPEGMELDWQTVESVAWARRADRRRKPEQLINFTDGVVRLFWQDAQPPRELIDKLNRYFGTDQWKSIVMGRKRGDLRSGDAVRAALDLYKQRLCKVLGYKHALDKGIRYEKVTMGRLAYHLVFASDHPAAERIMNSAFNRGFVGQQRLPLPDFE